MQLDELEILRKQVQIQAEKIANLEYENNRQQAIVAVMAEQIKELTEEKRELATEEPCED